MATVDVFNMAGEKVSEMELNDAVFAIEPNKYAMHACVVAHLANRRRGTQSTLTRAEVSGGGKKPWRQKGSGRARQGSTRAPQWYHGGVALGPKPRSYDKAVNKKVRALAIKSALSAKLADGELKIVDDITLEEIKTKTMAGVLGALGSVKPLVLTAEKNDNVRLSTRNIAGAKSAVVGGVGVYDLLNCGTLILTKAAAEKFEEVYA